MNNETHEDRVKILEGAPKDGKATHICIDGDYYKCIDGLRNGKQWEFWDSSQISKVDRWDWVGDMYLVDLVGLRSLADIQKLVDMQNEIDRLNCELSDIKQFKSFSEELEFNSFIGLWRAYTDLKQKVEGLDIDSEHF